MILFIAPFFAITPFFACPHPPNAIPTTILSLFIKKWGRVQNKIIKTYYQIICILKETLNSLIKIGVLFELKTVFKKKKYLFGRVI